MGLTLPGAGSGGSLVASPAPGDAGKFLAVNDTESGYELVPAPAGGLSVPAGFYEADMDAVLTVPSGQVTALASFDAFYGEANAPVTYDGNSSWTVERGFWFVANTYMEWETNAVGSRSVGLIMDNRYLPQKPGQFWHHELAALGLFSGGAGRVHTFPIMYMPAGAIFYFAVHQDSGGDLDISYAEIDLAVVQLDPPL